MQDYFSDVSRRLTGLLRGSEVLTCAFHGERSDFVRFHRAAVRQAGSVNQQRLRDNLIARQRQASASLTLGGNFDSDGPALRAVIESLREQLDHLPEDPYLLYSQEINSTQRILPNRLPDGPEACGAILDAAAGRDLVGIYASGDIFAGFANSLGQHNWYGNHSFNFDWSLHVDSRHNPGSLAAGAFKGSYAGTEWDSTAVASRFARDDEQLAALSRPAREVSTGHHRVYLAPAALFELVDLLGFGGFGLRAHRTRTTPLLRLAEGQVRLDPSLEVTENTAAGVAPDFQGQGFVRPDRVSLIESGHYRDWLVSPRSAIEYAVPTNGANSSESPQSIDVAGGALPIEDVLSELGTGIYVSNLWYLNYSDRRACRTTGMTRFATFQVENGQIVAPLRVMRFDESVYRMLGEKLVGLTAEREMIPDPQTYGARSTRSARLPGVLVDDFTLTL